MLSRVWRTDQPSLAGERTRGDLLIASDCGSKLALVEIAPILLDRIPPTRSSLCEALDDHHLDQVFKGRAEASPSDWEVDPIKLVFDIEAVGKLLEMLRVPVNLQVSFWIVVRRIMLEVIVHNRSPLDRIEVEPERRFRSGQPHAFTIECEGVNNVEVAAWSGTERYRNVLRRNQFGLGDSVPDNRTPGDNDRAYPDPVSDRPVEEVAYSIRECCGLRPKIRRRRQVG